MQRCVLATVQILLSGLARLEKGPHTSILNSFPLELGTSAEWVAFCPPVPKASASKRHQAEQTLFSYLKKNPTFFRHWIREDAYNVLHGPFQNF